jgi:hypothetical protein
MRVELGNSNTATVFEQLRRLFKQRPALELRVRELRTVLLLTPRAFEAAVADLLTEMGYRRVKVAGGPGDLAADITCKAPDGGSVIVQCKQYALGRSVGSKEIQLFLGMAFTHHKADKAIYVTTASYTAPAMELAARHRIELIDGDRLATLLLDLRGPAETDELEEVGLAELVARGIYDPAKVQAEAPSILGPAPLIPGEVIALGLPKSCEACGGEMEVRCQTLGWTRPICGSVEDWEQDARLGEWPERRVFHEFLAALNGRRDERAASFFTRGAPGSPDRMSLQLWTGVGARSPPRCTSRVHVGREDAGPGDGSSRAIRRVGRTRTRGLLAYSGRRPRSLRPTPRLPPAWAPR